MMLANRAKEWFLLGVIFALLPMLFFVFVVLRGRRNMAQWTARQAEIEQRMQAFVPVQPLSAAERQLLSDPRAPWRERMPRLEGDAARLWHYHQTITRLQATLKQGGVLTGTLRSSFDPVRGSFTLPPGLQTGAGKVAPGKADPGNATADIPGLGGQPQAWVLEVSVEGPSSQLFRALELLPGVEPILEPLGLRWESTPEGRKQYLVLRNLVLAP